VVIDAFLRMSRVKVKILKLISVIFIISFVSNISAYADLTENEKLIAVQKVMIVDRPLIMRGMGLTQLLNDDYYIGAFYLDDAATFATGEDLIFIDAPRRMEFRFASGHKVSARGFGRKIAEGIRINNEKNNIESEKDKLRIFMSLFKGSYKKGDIVRFDYHNSFGTRVSLNGKTLGTIKRSRDFYRLLVRLWVGERPPSSLFKQGIIGKNEDNYSIELLKRFVSLKN
jgi:hypothetical protein